MVGTPGGRHVAALCRAPDRCDAEVLIDEAMAWRLFTRGLSQEQAREQVTLVGDQVLASRVFEMVSIIA